MIGELGREAREVEYLLEGKTVFVGGQDSKCVCNRPPTPIPPILAKDLGLGSVLNKNYITSRGIKTLLRVQGGPTRNTDWDRIHVQLDDRYKEWDESQSSKEYIRDVWRYTLIS
jgi:hypothetical protein